MSPLWIQLARIRHRWWLVLVVMVITVAGTVLYSKSQHTVHTGTRALRVSSQNRGPEQDAVLAQGYVEFFNQPSTKQVLRVKVGLPSDVGFSARNSASSPILYIEATAPYDDLAVASVNKVTETFRDEINTQVQQSDDHLIDNFRAQIAQDQDNLKRIPSPSTEFSTTIDEMSEWRKSINDLKVDTTNQLMDVLPTAGVSSTSPKVAQNAALALIGGMILGLVAALTLASAENFLASPQEMPQRSELTARVTPDTNALPSREQSHA